MNKFKRLGNTFFIIATILWLIPIIVYGIYYATFVKIDEFDMQEQRMTSVANIISSKVDYSKNYYIDDEFLKGVELGHSYSISILNEFGETIYSSNKKFLNRMYSSPEVLEILGGRTSTIRLKNDNVMSIYAPIIYNKVPVGIVIISENVESNILANVKSASNLIAFILILSLSVLTFIMAKVLTRPVKKLRDSVLSVANGNDTVVRTGEECYEISLIRDSMNQMIQRSIVVEESRKQFVADVSHELKTPLSSMKVLADTILNQKDAPKEMYDEFLEDISAEVDRESKIIDDLLTMVSLDNKETGLNYELVSINDLIEQIMRLLLPIAKKKDISLEVNSFRNVEAYVDETKFYLTVMNLVENAIKYNKIGGKVTITLDADYREFTMKIIDTGIGIEADDADKIFDRFYRVDKMRSRDSGGTGLGLSIVHKTILLHGGTINCHSEVGFGTTFIVKMPLSKWENKSKYSI